MHILRRVLFRQYDSYQGNQQDCPNNVEHIVDFHRLTQLPLETTDSLFNRSCQQHPQHKSQECVPIEKLGHVTSPHLQDGNSQTTS